MNRTAVRYQSVACGALGRLVCCDGVQPTIADGRSNHATPRINVGPGSALAGPGSVWAVHLGSVWAGPGSVWAVWVPSWRSGFRLGGPAALPALGSPKPRPRTSRERIEPAGAFGTRHHGTSTLNSRHNPDRAAGSGAIRRDSMRTSLGRRFWGARAPWARRADLGRSAADHGRAGHLGRDARTSSGAVGFPKTASPDCAASTGQRNESSECEPTRRVMKTDPRSAPGRIRSFPGSIPVGGARSDAYQSGEVVMGASGKSGPGPRRVTAARRVTVARRSGRTAHCTDPFGTGPTRVATR